MAGIMLQSGDDVLFLCLLVLLGCREEHQLMAKSVPLRLANKESLIACTSMDMP